MHNPKDIQFVGKHDYDDAHLERYASKGYDNFSLNIFQWELKTNGKAMKKGKGIVRVSGPYELSEKVFSEADRVVKLLDAGTWDLRKRTWKIKLMP